MTDTLTPQEMTLALESSRKLSELIPASAVKCRIQSETRGSSSKQSRKPSPGIDVVIPQSAFRLLVELLTEMSKGNAVTLFPVQAELTPSQASKLLNVSRPFLVELLNQGEIPFRMVGTHRRIRVEDVRAYKEQTDKARLEALAELAKQAQELEMGY
jgi:excisionase family DNA binding protein